MEEYPNILQNKYQTTKIISDGIRNLFSLTVSPDGICYTKGTFSFRQFNSALADLMEALKMAPNNRKLWRLLVRVKEECKEQAKLETIGTLSLMREETVSPEPCPTWFHTVKQLNRNAFEKRPPSTMKHPHVHVLP